MPTSSAGEILPDLVPGFLGGSFRHQDMGTKFDYLFVRHFPRELQLALGLQTSSHGMGLPLFAAVVL